MWTIISYYRLIIQSHWAVVLSGGVFIPLRPQSVAEKQLSHVMLCSSEKMGVSRSLRSLKETPHWNKNKDKALQLQDFVLGKNKETCCTFVVFFFKKKTNLQTIRMTLKMEGHWRWAWHFHQRFCDWRNKDLVWSSRSVTSSMAASAASGSPWIASDCWVELTFRGGFPSTASSFLKSVCNPAYKATHVSLCKATSRGDSEFLLACN